MPRSHSRRLGLAGFLCLIASGPLGAQETPRSIGDCERLKNDLAYNQCLSMFGPAAKNIAGGDGAASPAPALAAAAIPMADDPAPEAGRGRRGRARYGRRGRQVAVFTAGGSEETRTYRRRRRR
ncbi:hypothetical protein J2X36_002049 [Methylobacterium sp. BE186]|uniref:hypothetical protein n=1 Tax=Methylobacterium sp. BE186 TaxID=2817715 RepID=UPI0028660086|nr:hypothetical protein [Methylobacterium sp. BE186]MDR7037302.1 hypothetical protein [Methylobacterium sp. BE186]